MGIAFQCPQCRKRYQVPDESAGTRLRCAHCGAEVDVPAATPAALAALKPRPVPRNPALGPVAAPSLLPAPALNAPRGRIGSAGSGASAGAGAPVPSAPAFAAAPALPGGARAAPPPPLPPLVPSLEPAAEAYSSAPAPPPPPPRVAPLPPPTRAHVSRATGAAGSTPPGGMPGWAQSAPPSTQPAPPTGPNEDAAAALSAMADLERTAEVDENQPMRLAPPPPPARGRASSRGTSVADLVPLGTGRWSPSRSSSSSTARESGQKKWYHLLDADRPVHRVILIVLWSVAALAFIGVAVVGVYLTYENVKFNATAVPVRGQVVRTTWRGASAGMPVTRRTKVEVTYEYAVQGMRYRARINRTRSELPSGVGTAAPGPQMVPAEVYYDPADPTRSWLGRKPIFFPVLKPLAFGLFGVGFAGKALGHLRRATQRRRGYDVIHSA